jgi:hypothetical protein
MIPSCATFADSAFSRSWKVCKSCRSQMVRTPAGETVIARFFNSLATRTWPNAGCSSANSTTACSIRGSARFFRFGFLREISASAVSPPVSYSSLNR